MWSLSRQLVGYSVQPDVQSEPAGSKAPMYGRLMKKLSFVEQSTRLAPVTSVAAAPVGTRFVRGNNEPLPIEPRTFVSVMQLPSCLQSA